MKLALIYPLAAVAEIGGCFAFWAWLKLDRSPVWLVPGVLSLIVFAWLLTLHPAASGRIYAAYGGIYIFSALIWLRFVDQVALSRWDLLGGAIVLTGAALIILQPQGLIR